MSNQVDHAEIKMGQILTIVISASALILQNTHPLMALAVVFLLSGTLRTISPFSLFYRWVVHPLGLIQSDYRLDNIQPHKFGQLIDALTVVIALTLIEFGYPLIGWGMVVLLIGLTVVSYAGWCIGCFMYYQLNRLGLGGFFNKKPTDTSVTLGMRPNKS